MTDKDAASAVSWTEYVGEIGEYYDLDSAIVQNQAEEHGEY